MRNAGVFRAGLAAVVLGLTSGALPAAPPDRSVRPEPRPEVRQAVALDPDPARSPRPLPRPEPWPVVAVALPVPDFEPLAPDGQTVPPQIAGNGLLCGVPGLDGLPLEPVPGAIAGCGVAEGVQISAVGGVGLSRAINVDCPTARALLDWVTEAVRPEIATLGGGLAGLDVAASYACRPRNNIAGGRISVHGRGAAVDVFGFVLESGETLTVRERWSPFATRRLFRTLHDAACGTFTTVLGPDADIHHQDHFHLDTEQRRSGAYCR